MILITVRSVYIENTYKYTHKHTVMCTHELSWAEQSGFYDIRWFIQYFQRLGINIPNVWSLWSSCKWHNSTLCLINKKEKKRVIVPIARRVRWNCDLFFEWNSIGSMIWSHFFFTETRSDFFVFLNQNLDDFSVNILLESDFWYIFTYLVLLQCIFLNRTQMTKRFFHFFFLFFERKNTLLVVFNWTNKNCCTSHKGIVHPKTNPICNDC